MRDYQKEIWELDREELLQRIDAETDEKRLDDLEHQLEQLDRDYINNVC